MLPVVDPTALSFINEAKSASRALAWLEAGLKESLHQIREVEAAVASEIGSMEPFRQIQEESLRQMREFEAATAQEIRAMESFRQMQEESCRQVRDLEAALAPPTGMRECFYQTPEDAELTIERAFAAPQMQYDRKREPAAPIAPVADSRVEPSAPASSKKQNEGNWGPRPRTRAAAVALGLYLADRPYNPKLEPSRLAQLAVDFAAKQGFKGADLLDPGDKTIRTLAEDFLAGRRVMAEGCNQK